MHATHSVASHALTEDKTHVSTRLVIVGLRFGLVILDFLRFGACDED